MKYKTLYDKFFKTDTGVLVHKSQITCLLNQSIMINRMNWLLLNDPPNAYL